MFCPHGLSISAWVLFHGPLLSNTCVCQYYAGDHLSSMERHKIELKKVREDYRIHEGDCGSSQVQSKFYNNKNRTIDQGRKNAFASIIEFNRNDAADLRLLACYVHILTPIQTVDLHCFLLIRYGREPIPIISAVLSGLCPTWDVSPFFESITMHWNIYTWITYTDRVSKPRVGIYSFAVIHCQN